MAVAAYMLVLGDFAFHVDSAAYEKLQREDQFRWATMERLELEPTQQRIGFGTRVMTLVGTIYGANARGGPLMGGGVNPGAYQVEAMRVEMNRGEPLVLVDGRGNFYGMWCIRSVKEIQTYVMDTSGPRKQVFEIEIIHQPDDAVGGAAAAGGE